MRVGHRLQVIYIIDPNCKKKPWRKIETKKQSTSFGGRKERRGGIKVEKKGGGRKRREGRGCNGMPFSHIIGQKDILFLYKIINN